MPVGHKKNDIYNGVKWTYHHVAACSHEKDSKNFEVAEIFKSKTLSLTGLHYAESFKFQLDKDLLPDAKEYKPREMAERNYKYKKIARRFMPW
jgi:hypothetical protein